MSSFLSKEVRNTSLFLRNEFCCAGRFELPLIRKQDYELVSIDLISFSDTCSKDTLENRKKGVHFFIDDYRFEKIYLNPSRSLDKLSQYKFLISPDYSLYYEMPRALQIYNVFRNRWVSAYWQSKGLFVIPCVSWSDALSYEYCFDSIEKHSTVAIGMIGCKKNNKASFLRGYFTMLDKISPDSIIVFGSPYPEMKGNIIPVDYKKTREVNRNGR